jgi:hypothetical protein
MSRIWSSQMNYQVLLLLILQFTTTYPFYIINMNHVFPKQIILLYINMHMFTLQLGCTRLACNVHTCMKPTTYIVLKQLATFQHTQRTSLISLWPYSRFLSIQRTSFPKSIKIPVHTKMICSVTTRTCYYRQDLTYEIDRAQLMHEY